MKSTFKLFALTLILVTLPANAEWSSGGGELIKDSQNPWFVQNTETVTYCIVIDTSVVGIDEDQADSTILDAISYWQTEFSYSEFSSSGDFMPEIKVATQDFKRIDCDLEQGIWADVTFQYGFLTSEQREFIGNVSKYAAMSVRTSYDRRSLRGRGFIYFAAESGPDSLSDPRFVENPWSRGDQDLLFWTTVHELGHVFGLPHNANDPAGLQVMSHRFVEHILTKDNADLFPRYLDPRQYFKLRPTHDRSPEIICYVGSGPYFRIAKEFFGIDPSWECLGAQLTQSGLTIYAAESYLDPNGMQKIGLIREVDSFTLLDNSMLFWLPSEQEVFPGANWVFTPAYKVKDISGEYVSVCGSVVRPVGLTLDPRKNRPLFDDLKVSGELNGRFYSNIIEGR